MFCLVGPYESCDVRLPDAYAHYGAVCGYIIGSDELEPKCLRYLLTQKAYIDAVKQADIVCLWIGFNDNNPQRKPGMEDRYMKLIDKYYEVNPRLSIYCGTLFFGNEDSFSRFLLNLDTDEYNKKYGRDIHVVDANTPAYQVIRGTSDFPEDDGHPAEPGNVKLGRMWADAILPQVLALNAEETEPDPRIHVRCLCTDLHDLTLRPNEGKTFHATVEPENADATTVLYGTDAPDILSVDDYGKIVAKTPGVAHITVKTIDGGLTARATCTVTGEPVDYTAGLRPVYREDFSATDHFEGVVDMITPAFHKISFRWNTVPDGTITGKDVLKFGNTVYSRITYWTANDYSRSRDRFFSLTIAGIELRISGGAKYAALYENGRLLLEDEALPLAAVCAVYGVLHEGTHVTLLRNNEPLGEATVSALPAEGRVEILFGKLNHKTYIADMEVFSD